MSIIGHRILVLSAALFAAAMLWVTPASAQATRTWVSGVGDDANPCSRTAPCKTFAGAISKTAAGGEITCLDPGGFGGVTITKSITIDCTGTMGSILASSITGVLVNGVDVDVVLRGLSINGGSPASAGLYGVRFLQGSSLTIISCAINGFRAAGAGNGIAFTPSTAAELYVFNTTVVNNRLGILIAPTGAGVANVTLEQVNVSNSQTDGLRVATSSNSGPGAFVTAEDSVFTGNQNGIVLFTPAGTNFAVAKLVGTTVASNTSTGLLADGATVRGDVSASNITNNGTGVSAINGAFLSSYLDNLVDRNGADGAFSGSIAKK